MEDADYFSFVIVYGYMWQKAIIFRTASPRPDT